MKTTITRRFLHLVLLALLAVLAACTGTKAPSLPTLLLVGVEEGGVPQLLLLEHRDDPSVPTAERLRLVAGSRRPLLAPAVAVDVTAREFDRDAAWVLSRSVTVASGARQVTAYLQSFSVTQIDPSAPSAFAEQVVKRRTLTDPGGGGDFDQVSTANPSGHICPTALQVSRTGAYAVILDDPGACGFPSSDAPVMWLLNTATGAAQVLEGNNDVLRVRPYSDQQYDNERAYFLVGGTSTAQVYTVTDFTTGRTGSLGSTMVAAEPNDIIDLGGSESLLVVLSQKGLVPTELATPATPAETKTTATIANAREVTVDPRGAGSPVLVRSNSQVAVHLDVSDDKPSTESFSAHAATIVPLNGWAYLVGNGEMLVIDLWSRLSPDEILSTARQPLAELTLPMGPDGRPVSVITWLLGTDPAPSSP